MDFRSSQYGYDTVAILCNADPDGNSLGSVQSIRSIKKKRKLEPAIINDFMVILTNEHSVNYRSVIVPVPVRAIRTVRQLEFTLNTHG
jgi:hypothetical protein